MAQLSLPFPIALPKRPQIRMDRHRVQFIRAQFTKTRFNRPPTPTALPTARFDSPPTLMEHHWAALSLTKHTTDTVSRKEASFIAEEGHPSSNLKIRDMMLPLSIRRHKMEVTDLPLVDHKAGIPGGQVEVSCVTSEGR